MTMASFKTISKNLPYISQQLGALLGNTSGSVKLICAVVFFTYWLSFSEESVKLLSVTPGYILPRVWTLFTFCFLEIHFWEVCVDLVTVGLCGKLIEPLWGQMEIMTFFTVVNVGVGALSAFFYLFLYMCNFNTEILFDVHIHGLAGFIAGLSVAVKQIMPDHLIVKTPLGKLTNRNVPLSIVLLSLIAYVSGLLEGTNPTMFISGILVSWTYLRFYQYHSNGTRGDMADSFSFANFFPTVLQPPVSVVCNTIHSGLVRIGLCKKTVRRFDMSQAPTGVTVTLPGNDPHDMERRKQIALKALSERLSKSEGSGKHKKDSSSSSSGPGGMIPTSLLGSTVPSLNSPLIPPPVVPPTSSMATGSSSHSSPISPNAATSASSTSSHVVDLHHTTV